MYFSICAPQSVVIPTPAGPVTLQFRVNAQDTSLVEIHAVGASPDGIDGTHILTFKRNGGAQDQTFTPAEQPALKDDGPVPTVPGTPIPAAKPYASVDDDAVRGDDWKPVPMASSPGVKPKPSVDTKPAA